MNNQLLRKSAKCARWMMAWVLFWVCIEAKAESEDRFLQDNLPKNATISSTVSIPTPLDPPTIEPSSDELKIAVMLPSAGAFAEAAEAVRNGMILAWYRSGNRGRLVFFDTAKADVSVQYQEIVAMGMQLVIGPLDKEDVQTLARALRTQGKTPVPVLALNRLENNEKAPPSFYQFGYSPEDEARFVAQRGRDLGLSEMVMLAPEGKWGDRMLSAFKSELDTLGLSLAAARRFSPKERDFKTVLAALVPAAKKNTPPPDVKFTQDVLLDTPQKRGFFIAAQPAQARLVVSQMQALKSSMPILGTSHLFEGTLNPKGDAALNGVEFCDIPWMLDVKTNDLQMRNEAKKRWPELETRYSRLMALGVDAWLLADRVVSDAQRTIGFNGSTGILHLTLGGQYQRRLRWARFQNGVPQLKE